MIEPEIDLFTLPAAEWREILSAASELDLIHGGYFRARPAGIVFFCSPENAPDGWPLGFPEGSPDLPRAHVGEAERIGWDAERDEVSIRLVVANWGAMRAVKAAFDRGDYQGRFPEYVRDQEAALRGRSEDRAWLRRQFSRLRAHASGQLLGAL